MSTALIQLSKGKKALVSFGAIMLTVAVACYGLCSASGVTADTVQKGVNGVFLTAGLVTVVGVVLVIAIVRPMLDKDAAAEETAA